MTARQWKEKLVKKVTTHTVNIDGFNIIAYNYDSVPDVLKLTESDEGKGVWIAGEYKTISAELKEFKGDYMNVEIKGFRKVKGSSASDRTFYEEEVILHPDELTEERLKSFGYEISDGRKNESK